MEGEPRRQPDAEEITVRKSDGLFVARDENTGVSSQGETKSEALENLAEALSLYDEPVPEDEDVSEPVSAPWF